MSRRRSAALLGLLLLVPGACATTEEEPAMPDLDAEETRLTEALTALDGVREVEVQLRSDPTVSRQVTLHAASDLADPAGLHEALDAVTREGWGTLAFVPSEVRASIVGAEGLALDVRDLGFSRLGASSTWLFDRYGPPAADDGWRP